MTTRRFALERGGPRRLEVRWRWPRRDARVSLDGVPVGAPLDRRTFLRGRTLALPDGTALIVRWAKPEWWSVGLGGELRLERQGVPVPGSDGDPPVVARRAARLAGFFGALMLLIGGAWALAAKAAAAATWAVVLGAEGLVVLVLAVVGAFGVRGAILAAAVVLAFDGVAQSALVLWVGGYPNPLGLAIRAAMVVQLVRSWRRMRALPAPVEVARVFE
jgi:hypothetical protein